jgi:hypothetical protein
MEGAMLSVTVFRHVPRPLTGMVGVVHDRAFEGFEERLDWLESVGVLVERFDPGAAPGEVAAHPAAHELLSTRGDTGLPIILVNEAVVSSGRYPSRSQLARAVGRGRYEIPAEVTLRLAAIGAAAAIGFEDEVDLQAARAREMGIPEATVRLASEAGANLRHAGQMHPVP